MSTNIVFLKIPIMLSLLVTGLPSFDLESCDVADQCLKTSTITQFEQKIALISKPAPYWQGLAIVDGKVKEMKLTDFLGKYLVLFFYPLDFTFVCPTEVLALNDHVEDFQKIGTEVVGVSVDSHFTHLAWINSLKKERKLKDLKIPLLSDLTHEISRNYGVYLCDKGHSLRGLFIIDPKGILRQITLNDLPVGRSVEEILRLVKALQLTDGSGELCPSGWKPGQKTITENPESEKENKCNN